MYKNKRLYRYDKEHIKFEPIHPITSFLANNPIIVAIMFVGVMVFGCFKYNEIDASMKNSVEIRDKHISDLENEMRMEEEFDTLFIRIAYATLEGNKPIPFNDSIVYAYIKSCGAWYPDVVMAQFKMESASGKSDVAKNAHNFFGMRPVKGSRSNYTTQRKGKEYKGYGVYDNWKLSVLDKILWDHYRFGREKPSRETYINTHSQYAEAEEYTKHIEQVAKKYR